MARDRSQHGPYVERVREDTQRDANELLKENENLRLGLVSAQQGAARVTTPSGPVKSSSRGRRGS